MGVPLWKKVENDGIEYYQSKVIDSTELITQGVQKVVLRIDVNKNNTNERCPVYTVKVIPQYVGDDTIRPIANNAKTICLLPTCIEVEDFLDDVNNLPAFFSSEQKKHDAVIEVIDKYVLRHLAELNPKGDVYMLTHGNSNALNVYVRGLLESAKVKYVDWNLFTRYNEARLIRMDVDKEYENINLFSTIRGIVANALITMKREYPEFYKYLHDVLFMGCKSGGTLDFVFLPEQSHFCAVLNEPNNRIRTTLERTISSNWGKPAQVRFRGVAE